MAEHTSTLFESVEQWRPIPGFNDWYIVSDMGSVRRVKATLRHPVAARPLKTPRSRRGKGYPCVCLGGRCHQVHQLVAAAFLGPQSPGMHVNHINGITTDNRASNLEYVTPSENLKHAYRMNLKKPVRLLGESNPSAMLDEDAVRKIRQMRATGMYFKSIAKALKVSAAAVRRVAHGKSWKHVI